MKPRGLPPWPNAAAALVQAVPRARLHPRALAWLDGRPARERWAVALSGGSDSVALLVLVAAHWPERRGRLVALHFDHGLRGAVSARDARFCARLCAALGVKFVTRRWPRRERAESAAAARAARFRFFDQAMGRAKTPVLLLGHQQDDIAESMLMRLARGSGAGGLAAPRPVHALRPGRRRTVHVRPLLTLGKAEVVAALRQVGVAWREDASNAENAHFRNRVRRHVVPAWTAAAGRNAVGGAALTRELLEEDHEALEAIAAQNWLLGPARSLNLRPLAVLPKAIVRRILHRWLLGLRPTPDLSRPAFEALLAAAIKGESTRQSLGPTQFAVIRRAVLRVESAHKRVIEQ